MGQVKDSYLKQVEKCHIKELPTRLDFTGPDGFLSSQGDMDAEAHLGHVFQFGLEKPWCRAVGLGSWEPDFRANTPTLNMFVTKCFILTQAAPLGSRWGEQSSEGEITHFTFQSLREARALARCFINIKAGILTRWA